MASLVPHLKYVRPSCAPCFGDVALIAAVKACGLVQEHPLTRGALCSFSTVGIACARARHLGASTHRTLCLVAGTVLRVRGDRSADEGAGAKEDLVAGALAGFRRMLASFHADADTFAGEEDGTAVQGPRGACEVVRFGPDDDMPKDFILVGIQSVADPYERVSEVAMAAEEYYDIARRVALGRAPGWAQAVVEFNDRICDVLGVRACRVHGPDVV